MGGVKATLPRRLARSVWTEAAVTAQRADRIVVLEDGRNAEFGTHDRLLATDGPYRRLVVDQTAGVPALSRLRACEASSS